MTAQTESPAAAKYTELRSEQKHFIKEARERLRPKDIYTIYTILMLPVSALGIYISWWLYTAGQPRAIPLAVVVIVALNAALRGLHILQCEDVNSRQVKKLLTDASENCLEIWDARKSMSDDELKHVIDAELADNPAPDYTYLPPTPRHARSRSLMHLLHRKERRMGTERFIREELAYRVRRNAPPVATPSLDGVHMYICHTTLLDPGNVCFEEDTPQLQLTPRIYKAKLLYVSRALARALGHDFIERCATFAAYVNPYGFYTPPAACGQEKTPYMDKNHYPAFEVLVGNDEMAVASPPYGFIQLVVPGVITDRRMEEKEFDAFRETMRKLSETPLLIGKREGDESMRYSESVFNIGYVVYAGKFPMHDMCYEFVDNRILRDATPSTTNRKEYPAPASPYNESYDLAVLMARL